MLLATFIPFLLAIGVVASPLDSIEKRGTVYSDVTVFAYGNGISGLPIGTNSNGIAMVSSNTSSQLSKVTWTMDILGDTAWTVAINTTTNATATNATFYIIPTSASFEPVGFVTANQTAPTGAVTTSFELYGSQVVYIADDSFEAQFWAKTTNASDVWEIRWNADGVAEDDSVPVTLKVIPSTT